MMYLRLVLFFFFLGAFILRADSAQAFLGLGDGALITGTTPEVYIIENGMKRWIPNPELFNVFEFPWENIRVISDDDIKGYPTGKPIAKNDRYPSGALIRGPGTKVYIVKNGTRQWIETETDFENLGLDWVLVMNISDRKLKSISEGKPLKQKEKITRPLTILQKTPDKVVEDPSVKFQFSGVAGNPNKRTLSFETFIEGMDANWVRVSVKERSVTLPKKSGAYTFFIRAKDQDGNADKTPKSFSFVLNVSSHFGDVAISGSSARSADPAAENIVLTGKTTSLVSLVGWKLESKKFHTNYAIPTDVYDIPNHPAYERKDSLALDSKRKAIIYTGRSPTGINFRLNKCIGYLNVYYAFKPALPNYCPRPDMNEAKDLNLTPYCQKIISGLSTCKEPNLNDMLMNAECRDYLKERFSYSKCVERNNAFYDFLTDEWRVYLGQSAEVWANTGDTILLKDEQGHVVSKYTY